MREEFQNVSHENIPRSTIFQHSLFYAKAIAKSVDVNAIRNNDFNVLISTKGVVISSIINLLLMELGCGFRITQDDIALEMKKNSYDLGCRIDSNGEEMELYDEYGKLVEKDRLSILRSLICLRMRIIKVVVPYTALPAIETIAESMKGKVIRTKSSQHSLMSEVLKRETIGAQMLPLYCDAIVMLVKLLKLWQRAETLSEYIYSIPDFYTKEKVIECPWEQKAR